jgi:hypothetical protein
VTLARFSVALILNTHELEKAEAALPARVRRLIDGELPAEVRTQ